MTDLVRQLEAQVRAEVAETREVDADAAQRRERIMGLLADIRRVDPGYKLADLEELVTTDAPGGRWRLWDRATISRRTVHVLRDRKARGRSRVAA